MTLSLPSPGLKTFCGGILAGLMSAGIFVYALTLPPVGCVMMDILAATPLFMAGLSGGLFIGVLAALSAAIGINAVKTTDLSLYYIVVFALPATLLIWQALRSKQKNTREKTYPSEGELLTATTLYPCIAFLAGEAALMGQDGGLLGFTLEGMKTFANQMRSVPTDPERLKAFLQLLNMLAHMLPALIGCGWIMVMLLSMFVAQRTLKEQKWNIRPDFDLTAIAVPRWLLPTMVLCLALGYFAPQPFNYIGGNLSVILMVPFFFQGLSIVHARAAKSLFHVWILAAFYIFLLVPFPLTMTPTFFLTILVGITDYWFHFRARFARHNAETRRIR